MIGMYTDNWQPESEETRKVRTWISQAQTEAAKHPGMTVEPFMFGVTIRLQVTPGPKAKFISVQKAWPEIKRSTGTGTVRSIAEAFDLGRARAA